jgi:pimeloyl-ACP methyl ester carboxylesterase
MNERALGSPPAGAETSATNAFVRLDEVRHETLLVSGALDFPHINARSRHLASVMPKARLVEMASVAHLPNLERPEEFNALLRALVG